MKDLSSKTTNEKAKTKWLVQTTLAASAFYYFATDDLLEICYKIKGEEISLTEYGIDFIQGTVGILTLLAGAGMIAYRFLNKK
jgi:hypothetical protein